jgi:hypothetical protein
MSDIVERLRKWCHAVNAASAQDLMDEAADEIERLEELRQLDGESMGVLIAECQDMKDRLVNGDQIEPLHNGVAGYTDGISAVAEVKQSYEKIDEKRMNANTNRDATPCEVSVRGACTLTKPAAWHFKCDEYESVTLLREHADAMTESYNTEPIPLYYAPTLTDEERQLFVRLEESFESLAHFFDTPSGVNRRAKEACDRDRKILKALMERLS